jgi:YHS domain-containing protein
MQPIMKKVNNECAVTGKEVIDSSQAPRSKVNGKTFTFCTSTCKDFFDRHLVKFAEKRYPATGQPAYATILKSNYNR